MPHLRILIVEDIELQAVLIKDLISQFNEEIIIDLAYSGAEAIDKVNSFKPDIVLLDLGLPDMSGLEVCKKIKSKNNNLNLKVIFITSDIESDTILNCFRSGSDDYISKPVCKEELFSRLRLLTKLKTTNDELKFKNDELFKQKALFEAIFKNSPIAMIIIDKNNIVKMVNYAFIELFGYSEEDLVNFLSVFYFPELDSLIKNNFYSKKEIEYSKKDGERFLSETITTKISDNDGKLIGSLSLISDITQRKEHETKLKQSSYFLKQAQRIAQTGHWEYDIKSGIVFWSDELYQILECKPETHNPGIDLFLTYVHPEEKALVEKSLIKSITEKSPYEIEYRIITEKGTEKNVLEKGRTEYSINNYPERIIGTIQDITETKNRARKTLQLIIETENKEKKRFARDLHDGLGAILSSIRMYINMFQKGMIDDDSVEQSFEVIDELTETAIINTKEIAYGILPHTLEKYGLITSVKELCSKISKPRQIKATLTSNVENTNLDMPTQTEIYRVISELTNNTLKYAKAKNIEIIINQFKDNFNVKYTDNGIGFDYQKIRNTPKGMGLMNIENRIDALKGKCIIESKPKKGTRVIIVINKIFE